MMIRYEASIPRAACGFAAIAMTALVFGLAIVLPATIDTTPWRLRYGRMYAHPCC